MDPFISHHNPLKYESVFFKSIFTFLRLKKASWIALLSTANFEQEKLYFIFFLFFIFFQYNNEHPNSNNNISAIEEVKRLFNELRSNLSSNKTKRIRRKLYKKEAARIFFIEKEQDGILTNRQKNVIKNIARYIKNISTHLKNYGKHLSKKQKYQYDFDYLFNEDNEKQINVFKDARDLLNERRSNLSRKETNEIRKKLYKKEAVYNFLKEKEQNGVLTNSEKKVLKKIDKYLKNFKNDLDKLQKYQYNTTQGLDYLLNKPNEDDYYKPIDVKNAFDGSYVLHECNGDKDSRLSIDEYFNIIRPYLKDMINNHKSKGEGRIQLSMRIIFVSFTDANETREMHTKSDNITIMRIVETKDIINELFNTFRKRYQEGLETKMRGSSFTFECIDLLEYHLHKISLNRGISYN